MAEFGRERSTSQAGRRTARHLFAREFGILEKSAPRGLTYCFASQ
jgi:hypothetical protein